MIPALVRPENGLIGIYPKTAQQRGSKTTKRNNPKFAGELLPSGEGDTIAIIGEALAEALEIDNRTVAHDTIPEKTPEEHARTLAEADELLEGITSESTPGSSK